MNDDYDENFARAGLPDPRSQKETKVSEQTDLVALTIKRPDEALFKSSEAMLETARSYKITTADAALAAGADPKATKTPAQPGGGKARAKGKAEKAVESREQAELREAPVVISAAPKIGGVSTREIWKAEVTDKMAFLKYVVEKRPDLAALVQLDQGGLNAQARSLKDALDLPGIKAVKESIIAARSGS